MEGSIKAWMAQNGDKAEGIPLKVIDIHKEFLKVEIGGNLIQLIIPSTFHNPSTETVNSDCVFLAICLEKEVDETLKEALVALNEKLERVTIGPNSLNRVLDNTLQAFWYCKCRKPDTSESNSPQNEENRRDWDVESLKELSYLYRLAEEGRVQCEEALSRADECSIAVEILPWCSVSADPSLGTIEMGIEINGIMTSDNVTTALGFCVDSPLTITLNFSRSLWSAKELCPELFRAVRVAVCHNTAQFRNMESSIQRAVDGLDENIKSAVSHCRLHRVHQYGPQVLVPEIVKDFFIKSTREMTSDGVLNGLENAADSQNIFIRLLIFIGTHLRTLRSWCIICKNTLSPFSRLWYCDAELCLYRLEELGLGASVLQELQNLEVVELELHLAAAASQSSRDVFEPYPAFLLKEREIRQRSGFFSNYISGKSIQSSEASKSGESEVSTGYVSEVKDGLEMPNLDNKQLHLLMLLIKSFPPVVEMQKCANEYELRVKLGTSWHQKLSENKETSGDQFFENDFAKNFWLPYNVLRFVLFTNRLSLHLLRGKSRLNIPGSFYQFAVLYDSKREEYFESCRATKRSIFAFHGSALGNWYSILRNGLRCLSKTSYMSGGMSCGQGIYFSAEMNVSCRYSQAGSGWVNGKLKECSVVAICEIFSGHSFTGNHSHVVVPPEHENDIAIRYLVVFNVKGCRNKYVRITDTNLLSNKTDLRKHYEQFRCQYMQDLVNESLINKQKRLIAFQKRRIGSKASANCDNSVASVTRKREKKGKKMSHGGHIFTSKAALYS